jgi:predicted CoA-binding protein
MNHDSYPDAYIRSILQDVKTIALVGASANPARPSWIVTKYLLERGYDVIPINPGLAGGELLGKPVYGSLAAVPRPIDMVEIFRNSQAAGPITDEVLALDPLPKVLWMQLSVRNDEAAARAEARGLKVVMNRDLLAGGQFPPDQCQEAGSGRKGLPETEPEPAPLTRASALDGAPFR